MAQRRWVEQQLRHREAFDAQRTSVPSGRVCGSVGMLRLASTSKAHRSCGTRPPAPPARPGGACASCSFMRLRKVTGLERTPPSGSALVEKQYRGLRRLSGATAPDPPGRVAASRANAEDIASSSALPPVSERTMHGCSAKLSCTEQLGRAGAGVEHESGSTCIGKAAEHGVLGHEERRRCLPRREPHAFSRIGRSAKKARREKRCPKPAAARGSRGSKAAASDPS